VDVSELWPPLKGEMSCCRTRRDRSTLSTGARAPTSPTCRGERIRAKGNPTGEEAPFLGAELLATSCGAICDEASKLVGLSDRNGVASRPPRITLPQPST
jgi:hypothetical protein